MGLIGTLFESFKSGLKFSRGMSTGDTKVLNMFNGEGETSAARRRRRNCKLYRTCEKKLKETRALYDMKIKRASWTSDWVKQHGASQRMKDKIYVATADTLKFLFLPGLLFFCTLFSRMAYRRPFRSSNIMDPKKYKIQWLSLSLSLIAAAITGSIIIGKRGFTPYAGFAFLIAFALAGIFSCVLPFILLPLQAVCRPMLRLIAGMSHKARVITEYPCDENHLKPGALIGLKMVREHVDIMLEYDDLTDWAYSYANYYANHCGYTFSTEDFTAKEVIAEKANMYDDPNYVSDMKDILGTSMMYSDKYYDQVLSDMESNDFVKQMDYVSDLVDKYK